MRPNNGTSFQTRDGQTLHYTSHITISTSFQTRGGPTLHYASHITMLNVPTEIDPSTRRAIPPHQMIASTVEKSIFIPWRGHLQESSICQALKPGLQPPFAGAVAPPGLGEFRIYCLSPGLLRCSRGLLGSCNLGCSPTTFFPLK